MTEKERMELIDKTMTMLDGVESNLRQIWPEDKTGPSDKESIEYWIWYNTVCALVHIGDIRADLHALDMTEQYGVFTK